MRRSFCCGAKRSWRLAKLLLLRSEAELETCEAPFAAERSGAGDLRSTFYCGAKRSWRLAKLLLLRSEAELETCEAPFAAERSGAGDLRSTFLDGLGRALGGFGCEKLICRLSARFAISCRLGGSGRIKYKSLFFCNIAFQKQKFTKIKNAKYLSFNKFYFILADWGDLQEISISYCLSAH